MTTDPLKTAPATHSNLGRPVLIVLLLLVVAALAVVTWLYMSQGPAGREVVVELVSEQPVAEPEVYTSEILDAMADSSLQAQAGHRYKVQITDESREGASGVTRIGGLVTFVPDARVGEILVVEVTRIRRSTADATIVSRLGMADVVPPSRPSRPMSRETTPPMHDSPLRVGQVYSGTVEDLGRDGDGIVRVEGKVVFVPNAPMGETVTFRIVDDLRRFARGERMSDEDAVLATQPAPMAAASAIEDEEPWSAAAARVEDIVVGRRFDVTIAEQDRNNPDQDGVAHIDGLVVFVPGSQPGDQVRIRITDRARRFARAEVVERPEPVAAE